MFPLTSLPMCARKKSLHKNPLFKSVGWILYAALRQIINPKNLNKPCYLSLYLVPILYYIIHLKTVAYFVNLYALFKFLHFFLGIDLVLKSLQYVTVFTGRGARTVHAEASTAFNNANRAAQFTNTQEAFFKAQGRKPQRPNKTYVLKTKPQTKINERKQLDWPRACGSNKRGNSATQSRLV